MTTSNKIIEPVFVDTKHQKDWDKTKQKILHDIGYELVFIPDPKNAFSTLPMSPLLLPGDVITSCLLRAVMTHTASKNTFGSLLIKEIANTNLKKQ